MQVILSGEAPYQIVWASEAWLKLVGYPNDEACGKTLQLVEGPLTSQASVDQLTRAIRAGNAVKVPRPTRPQRALTPTPTLALTPTLTPTLTLTPTWP